MKVGLFFGSFNPVHIGHMIIANYMLEYTDLEKIWMVVSPQNPFKSQKSLAKDYDRLHLLNLAIDDHEYIKSSNVEFSLPKPSYTIDTLIYLTEKYPKNNFSLIMGGDNITHFHKWKNYEQILSGHDIYVYKRGDGEVDHQLDDIDRIHICEAPLLNISASYIRKSIIESKSIQYLVPQGVFEYLKTSSIYKNL